MVQKHMAKFNIAANSIKTSNKIAMRANVLSSRVENVCRDNT